MLTAASTVIFGAKRRLAEVKLHGEQFTDEQNHLRRLIADYQAKALVYSWRGPNAGK